MDSTEYKKSYQVEETHWWYRGQRHLISRFFYRHFSGQRDLTILDVGCGTGFNMGVIESFGSVYGIDISDDAITYCKKRGCKVLKASVETLPFSDNSFDAVTSMGVFYHNGVVDDLQGMREIMRVLKPQGRLLFFDSAMRCLTGNHDIVFHGVRRYEKAELLLKLQEAGCIVNRISYVFVLLFPLVYGKRKLDTLLSVRPKSEVVMTSRIINRILSMYCRLDEFFAQVIHYPFGLNIVAWAEKPDPLMRPVSQRGENENSF